MLFGVAFGFVEAAVVLYLREIGNFQGQYTFSSYHTYVNLGFMSFVSPVHTLVFNHLTSTVEVVREAATIVMLFCLAWVAGTTWRQRLGAFMVSFACWDLAYYLFLKVIDHWPQSLFTRDVFFLIPVAWIGPVLTPLVICVALLVGGARLYTT